MPEYAHDLGTDEAGLWYSVLLAGNAAGAHPGHGAPGDAWTVAAAQRAHGDRLRGRLGR